MYSLCNLFIYTYFIKVDLQSFFVLQSIVLNPPWKQPKFNESSTPLVAWFTFPVPYQISAFHKKIEPIETS